LIEERLPDYRLIAPRFPPMIGAYLLSLRLAGVTIDDTIISRIEASTSQFPELLSKRRRSRPAPSPTSQRLSL
jgi:hypothetical protein